MLIVTPNLHLNGHCKKAIETYREALGAQVQVLIFYSEANPQDWQSGGEDDDRVYHSELLIGGQRIMMSDDTSDFPPKGNTVSLVITFETAEEVRAAYDVLSQGGTVNTPMHSTTYSSCFVSLIDRYGVRWELMTEQTER